MKVSRHTFWATNSSGDVSGILMRPTDATCLYVFAHGAGAGMEHSFMEAAAGQLADRGIASPTRRQARSPRISHRYSLRPYALR